MVNRFCLLLLLLSALFLSVPLTHAAAESDQQEFAIVPAPGPDPATTAKGYFVYQVQPGAQITGALQLQNTVSHTLTVVLEGADARTAQKGGSAFSQAGEALTGMATWLHLDAGSVTLAPGEVQTVGFAVTVPTSTGPGQYLAGIAAYVPSTPPTAGPALGDDQLGAVINLQVRRVIAVEVDIPGNWQSSLQIPGVNLVDQPSGSSLGIHLRNDGATFLKPSGTLVISDASGKRLAEQPINMGTFVPGTDVVYPVALAARPAPGNYQLSVELSYDTNKLAQYHSTLAVAEAAPADAAAPPAAAPIDLSSGQQAPAATAPGAQAADADASPSPIWFYIAGGVALALASLVVLALALRRDEKAS